MCHIFLLKHPLSTWMKQPLQKRACGLWLAGLKEMEITLSSQLYIKPTLIYISAQRSDWNQLFNIVFPVNELIGILSNNLASQ